MYHWCTQDPNNCQVTDYSNSHDLSEQQIQSVLLDHYSALGTF